MDDMSSSSSIPEMSLPAPYWNALSQDDRTEFIQLRNNFHHGQKLSAKDRRIITFSKELHIVLHYLERSEENKEERCVLCGVCFVGPIVCVNTRQLKTFLSRCKSSINGSFQQLGFVALRTKAKARSCVLTALPSLQNHQNILRQWTVRYASEDARFCFVSSYRFLQMPEITPDDLFDEKKPLPKRSQSAFFLPPNQQHIQQQQYSFNINNPAQAQFQPPPPSNLFSQQPMAPQPPLAQNPMQRNFANGFLSAPKPVSFQAKQINFELPSIDDFDPMEASNELDTPAFNLTSGLDDFNNLELHVDPLPYTGDDLDFGHIFDKPMKRSQSAFVWDFTDNIF